MTPAHEQEPARVPIPPPERIHSMTGSVMRIACPTCGQTWRGAKTSRYELHWRVRHDLMSESKSHPTGG